MWQSHEVIYLLSLPGVFPYLWGLPRRPWLAKTGKNKSSRSRSSGLAKTDIRCVIPAGIERPACCRQGIHFFPSLGAGCPFCWCSLLFEPSIWLFSVSQASLISAGLFVTFWPVKKSMFFFLDKKEPKNQDLQEKQ